ncbi:PAS domain-containing sensor histidine kinase [Sphingosinicella sp. BN140058]|uniref:PAS domain-containing sensor histidine kinase n=1 Tax=Sphingosinicella sp. BN140058 TaxID=1892855 RepID=UPI0013EB7A23|nr:PAS domain-containing sensor histidine kinase [Sphingosinicella sp. BN140058]
MTTVSRIQGHPSNDPIAAARIVENIVGYAWGCDAAGSCIYVTPGAGADLATMLSELNAPPGTAFTCRPVIHPEDYPSTAARWRESQRSGERYQVEHRMLQATGVYAWVRCSSQPLLDESGRISGWYGTVIALEASAGREDQFRQMVDTVPALIWCTTPDGAPSYINKQLSDALGMSLDDLVGPGPSRSLADIHPEDVADVEEALSRSFTTGSPFCRTYRQRRADGGYRWTEGRAEPLRGDDGAIIQWCGVCVDVHDRVVAQKGLQDRERQLRHLVDTVPSLTWCLSPDGQPSYYSEQLVRWLGVRVEDLDVGGMSRLAFAEALLVHPDDGREAHEELARCVRSGDPFKRKYRIRRHDGIFRWMDVRAQALRDSQGEIVQWYGVLIDIEELMRAQEELRNREGELAQLVDMVPSHIWRLDRAGEPTFFNKRMVDFLGMDVAATDRPGASRLEVLAEAIHPEDASQFEATLRHCIATGESFAMRYRLRRADGAYRWMSGRAEPIRDDRGRIAQWFGLCHDVDEQMRLYNEIAEREAKFRRLVDSDIIGIVIWDLDGTLIDANDAFLRMIQYDRKDVAAGLNWLGITPPEWQEVHAREEADELAATGKMQAREKEYYRKDGSRVPVLIGAACFDGQSRQGVAYILDLTERKRAEATLRDRERELSQLVDLVPIPLWRLSAEGKPVFFNKRMAEFAGGEAGSFEIEGAADFATLTAAAAHPDDAITVTRTMGEAFAIGQPFSMSYRLRRADGVFRWVLSNAEPLRDQAGRVVGWYGFSHDVDDQLRVEEALRERERFLWQIVETLPAMIDCANPEGEPVYRSHQLRQFLGYELEALDGPGKGRLSGTLDAGVHPEDVAGVKETYAHSLATGEPYARRHRLRRHDGEYRWVETRAAPMRDLEGRIIQWNVICLDVDAEVRAQEELRLAQERLSRASQAASLAELSASIAHEINQPLAAVVTNSHACQRWLAATPPNLERAQRTVERIVRDANSAAEVISRIRALFRHSGEPKGLAPLGQVVHDASRMLSDLARAARVRVDVDVSEEIEAVAFDGVQVQQVVLNLMRNAVEAMQECASERLLCVHVFRSGDKAQLEISDSGPGIGDPDNVFDAFYTTKRNGMGMGLAISRSIVETMGGKIWLRDNEMGGATFAFTLPIEAQPAP